MSPPTYLRILQSLEADIRLGRLRPGDAVLSHRAAARHWQVAVATVTRAYAEAALRGLLVSRPGAATRVAGAPPPEVSAPTSARHNLADNIPRAPTGLNADALLKQAFQGLGEGRARDLLDRIDPAHEPPEHLAALGEWLSSLGVPTAERCVIPSPGAQPALLVALRCVASRGEVACEPLVNPGLRAAARFLGIRLVPLACDAHGPLPEALDQAARQGTSALYASPTCSNPLALHWPAERRAALAEVARARDIWIIEDDDLRPLDPQTQPLARFGPARSISIVGSSKVAGFAMRTAAVAFPQALADAYIDQLRAAVWMASPLLVDVLAQWQAGGQLAALATARRAEAMAVQEMARAALARFGYRGHPAGLHGWLPLSRPWDGDRFAFHAARCGVAVTPAQTFAVHGSRPAGMDGARLSWAAGTDMPAALSNLVGLLEHGPGGVLT
ncbi:MAG: PLP-dependent aminotransferase family protein [Pseudomonadota bacterium]